MGTVTSPFRILTVCIGNVCRSPLAERLLHTRLPADRFVVASAGVGALVDRPMDASAAVELRRLGGDDTGFVARRLTPATTEDADLVLAATKEIRSAVLAESPAALRRTFTLRELAALIGAAVGETPAEKIAWAARHRSDAADIDQDVVDPFGHSAQTHRAVADAIDAAVEAIVAGLTR